MKKISSFIVSLLLAFGIFTAPAQAASQCKGISKTACATSTSCSWVKGYKRKDGAKVSGHCRTNKKAAKEKTKIKKKETKAKAKSKKDAAKKKAAAKKAAAKKKALQ